MNYRYYRIHYPPKTVKELPAVYNQKRWMKVSEAASLLKVSKQTVRLWSLKWLKHFHSHTLYDLPQDFPVSEVIKLKKNHMKKGILFVKI